MQQRYYDPVAGRFLSVDPVTTDAKTGGQFNRYAYADNNPYKYIDPDGRSPVHVGLKALDLAVSSIEIMSAFHTGGAGAGIRATADALLSVPGARAGSAIMKGLERAGGAAKGGKSLDIGSPTAGKPVDSATRERILARDRNSDGSWTCATCGQKTSNPDNVHTGHITPRSHGGDLSNKNLRCEGAACNLSQGDRSAPKPGMTCAERGSCGAPYGRTD